MQLLRNPRHQRLLWQRRVFLVRDAIRYLKQVNSESDRGERSVVPLDASRAHQPRNNTRKNVGRSIRIELRLKGALNVKACRI